MLRLNRGGICVPLNFGRFKYVIYVEKMINEKNFKSSVKKISNFEKLMKSFQFWKVSEKLLKIKKSNKLSSKVQQKFPMLENIIKSFLYRKLS